MRRADAARRRHGNAWLLRRDGNGTAPEISIATGQPDECERRYAGSYVGIRIQTITDAAHFLSAGIVSFARGLNDTPKIAAMLLVVQALEMQWSMTAVAAAMAVGGLLSAKRVADTMSHKIYRDESGPRAECEPLHGRSLQIWDALTRVPGHRIEPGLTLLQVDESGRSIGPIAFEITLGDVSARFAKERFVTGTPATECGKTPHWSAESRE